MISFKQFIVENDTKEVIAFANAGGKCGQYDNRKLSPTTSIGFASAGGSKQKLKESLIPKSDKPIVVNSKSSIFTDPDKKNEELGEEQHQPTYGVEPRNNKEHAQHIKSLTDNTNVSSEYRNIVEKYTSGSENLNSTLFDHAAKGTKAPDNIKADLWGGADSTINVPTLDKLIQKHKTQTPMTVYTGAHFDPSQHRDKILHLPSYTSTSVNPHVAKDFGIPFKHINPDTGNKHFIRHILRIEVPKGHPHLFTDPASEYHGQGEVILPRNTRVHIDQEPTHIIHGKFESHFDGDSSDSDNTTHYIWNAKILK